MIKNNDNLQELLNNLPKRILHLNKEYVLQIDWYRHCIGYFHHYQKDIQRLDIFCMFPIENESKGGLIYGVKSILEYITKSCKLAMKEKDYVEHLNKNSKSGYPHNKIYQIFNMNMRMKNPTTGEWIDAVCYTHDNEFFVREKENFLKEFILVQSEQNIWTQQTLNK